MRPCRRCRSPIENSVAVCPQCEAVQDESAKPPPGPVPPPILRRKLFGRAPAAPAPTDPAAPARRPGFVPRLLDDLLHSFAGEGFLILVLLIAVGAIVGGALAGVTGAIAGAVGAVIAIVLVFAVLGLLSSSEG